MVIMKSESRYVIDPVTGKRVNRARKVVNPKTGRMVRVGGRAYREAYGLVKRRGKSPTTHRKVVRIVRNSPKKKSPVKRRKPGPIVTRVFTLAPGVRI